MFAIRRKITILLIGLAMLVPALTTRAEEPLEARGPRTASHPAVELAQTLIGIPYRWSGADPARGFDCSGLVYYVFNQLQVHLPRVPRDLFHRSENISRAELRPGDLLFFHTFARLSHVGIYIGGGHFIHAPRRGQTVRIESMDTRYYQKRFAGARRVMDAPADSAPGPSL